ncbi:MAG: ReoY family proteolytic degradation factor [Thermoactinomyces sp.]
MKSRVSVAEKKEFIHWFLQKYELQKKEAAWLLSYLSSSDELLKHVHFVDHVRRLPKSMMISTKCSKMISFRFTKNKRVGADVETAFYDIRTYPHEDLYIGLYFKDRAKSPEYAAVLEVNPMEKHDLVQDHLLSLFAEMLLDQAVKEFQRRELYKKIDHALEERDEQAFLQLSEQWIKILES